MVLQGRDAGGLDQHGGEDGEDAGTPNGLRR